MINTNLCFFQVRRQYRIINRKVDLRTGPSNEIFKPPGSWGHGLHKEFQAQVIVRCPFRKEISYCWSGEMVPRMKERDGDEQREESQMNSRSFNCVETFSTCPFTTPQMETQMLVDVFSILSTEIGTVFWQNVHRVTSSVAQDGVFWVPEDVMVRLTVMMTVMKRTVVCVWNDVFFFFMYSSNCQM